ncbi:MAG TPA: O-antigen ligase family protein [Candidatus Limnocylindria bacterium]|nr:O-antigen ligase family protein [Candidatus Limnocylindria bacterium]
MIRRVMPQLAARNPAAAVASAAAVGLLLGLAVAWIWVAIAPPVYTSEAQVRLVVDAPAGRAQDAVRSAMSQGAVLADLAVSPVELANVGRRLEPPMAAADLEEHVAARKQPNLLLITVSGRADTPARAAEIAEAAMANLIARGPAEVNATGIRLVAVEHAPLPRQATFSYLPRHLIIGGIAGLTVALALALHVVARRRGAQDVSATRRPIQWVRLTVGVVAGAAIVAAAALEVPAAVYLALVAAAAAIAVLAPAAGFAMLGITIPLPDAAALSPLGLPPVLIAATGFGMLISAMARGHWSRPSPMIVLGLGYLGISAVAGFPNLNGFDGDQTVDAIARLIQVGSGLLLVAVSWIYASGHDPRAHLAVAVVAAAFASSLGVVQYMAVDVSGLPLQGLIFHPDDATTITRATGPFVNPNYFGFFSGLGLVLAMGVALGVPRARPMMILAAVVLIAGLFVSLSRGAMLATAAGVVALIWTRHRGAGTTVAIVAAVLVATFSSSLLVLRSGTPDFTAPYDVATQSSDLGRFAAMLSALPVWLNDPVFGVGFGQFGHESAWFVGSSLATSSHNEFLSILAEQGIIGTALLATLAVGLARRVLRADERLRAGAVAVLVAFAVGWITLEPLASLQTSGLVWLAVGAAAGATWPAPETLPQPAAETPTDPPPAAEPRPRRGRRRRAANAGA